MIFTWKITKFVHWEIGELGDKFKTEHSHCNMKQIIQIQLQFNQFFFLTHGLWIDLWENLRMRLRQKRKCFSFQEEINKQVKE